MKKLIYLLMFIQLFSCESKRVQIYDTPQKVVVTGRVNNYDPSLMEVEFSINNPGFLQDEIFASFDSAGYFKATFEIYHQTDMWLVYRTNFRVLVHPGDSMNIEFDGSKNDRSEILKTIKFSGDAAKINQDAATFQESFFSNSNNTNLYLRQKTIKDYDVNTYLAFIDSIHKINNSIYDDFIAKVSPEEEVSKWAFTFVTQWHVDLLCNYPYYHQMLNHLTSKEWDVATSYYQPLLKIFPIHESTLLAGYSLENLIINYLYNYIPNVIKDEEGNKKYISEYGYFAPPLEIKDSIFVYGIIRLTQDELFRQMVLTKYFSSKIEDLNIEKYEKFKNVIDLNIKEPFLREPLSNLYNRTKDKLENPHLASDAVLKKLANSSVNQIMDSIFLQNKGNILYIDCWSTSCGPCISEMPNSRELMKKMNGKNVSFIYLCIDSEEKTWKSWLNKLQIGGQHYLFDRKQSTDIRKSFEIKGIPFYILIDKDGSIIEKGSQLSPYEAKEKIEKLLKK